MSNWFDIGEAPPLAAGADLSAKYGYLVKQSAQTYVLAAAATDKIVGALQNKPASGETCNVWNRGKIPVFAGGTWAVGDLITSDGSGKGIVTTTPGDVVIGRASKIAASGDIGEVDAERFVL